MAKLGHVALDGTKIKANASKHKAMSYERMDKRAAELEAEVERWLSAAEAGDAEEDKAFGRDKSGEELPKWVADKKRRAEKIRAAKAELEAEAKAAAAAKAQAQAEAEERRKTEGRKKPGKPAAPPSDEPDRNCGCFYAPGNRVGLPGLDGGGCRDRTDGHRSLASLQNEAARRGFSARNDLSQRMSKSLAGKPKALTMNCYLPVSLRFHSLSSRSTAMVVTCSRALRRLQE